jgi:hypothetical protein
MRIIVIIVALFAMAGCATGPSLEELEAQALVTGDWSLVEKREARMAASRQPAPKCPPGSVAYCRSFMGDKTCNCVSNSAMQAVFSLRR